MKFSKSALAVSFAACFSGFTSAHRINRIPDSEWDSITHGSDILRQRSAPHYSKTKSDSYLRDYSMRSRVVDPSSLGVDDVRQLSGYLDDSENDKHLFFWFFESRNDPANDPVILWLNGGPGCSSMFAIFNELGPASIPNSDLNPKRNPYSWNNNASVMFLDQPVNTGFSYSSKTVDTSIASAKDFYSLMTLFFKQYPEYSKQDFHIAGESYAGHYIPNSAVEILSHADSNINLKSVLIGNGMTEPYTQYQYYRPMACGEGGRKAVLTSQQCAAMEDALPKCKKLIARCYETEKDSDCVQASEYCENDLAFKYYGPTGLSPYDIRTQMVQKATEVNSEKFLRNKVFEAFRNTGDLMKPTFRIIPGILEQIPILIYAGDADYICNWLGNYAWMTSLDWPGQSNFNAAEVRPLKFGGCGKEYGKVKHSGNFTFMRIYGAGHLVPSDQPNSSIDFVNRWITGEWNSRENSRL